MIKSETVHFLSPAAEMSDGDMKGRFVQSALAAQLVRVRNSLAL
jgi:hypothetical protein